MLFRPRPVLSVRQPRPSGTLAETTAIARGGTMAGLGRTLHTRMRSTANAPRWKVAVVGGLLLGLCGLTFWGAARQDRKSTRLNSSHVAISYAVFCLKKKRV